LVYTGERCDDYLREHVRNVHCEEIQIDELWAPVLCRARTARLKKYVGGVGDSYCYCAIERSTKFVVAWHVGKRNEKHTHTFIQKLAAATVGRFHLASDGWSAYPMAVWQHLGGRVDYGMLVKLYREDVPEERRKYAPARIISAKRSRVIGVPEKSKIVTSHCERLNGSIRAHCKRLSRCTYAFSKRWANHRAALAIFFMHYNFCRKHTSLRGETPAMAHGIAHHVWTVREMLENVCRS
jgi:IS1 family transposase